MEKGANQAVSAGLLGARVSFVGCVGDDSDGRLLVGSLGEAGVDLSFLRTEAAATGAAGIFVDDDGSNVIIVAAGRERPGEPFTGSLLRAPKRCSWSSCFAN